MGIGGDGGPSAEEALRALHQRHVTDPCKVSDPRGRSHTPRSVRKAYAGDI